MTVWVYTHLSEYETVCFSLYVCIGNTSAERNNKAEFNVKHSLSNFSAGAANKGVRAYSNVCSLHQYTKLLQRQYEAVESY